MNCYECTIQGEAVAAVAICKSCGVGMCLEHFLIAHDYRASGTTYGCRHDLPGKPKSGRRKRAVATPVPASNGHHGRLPLRSASAPAGAS